MNRKILLLFLAGCFALHACTLFRTKKTDTGQTEWQATKPFLKWTDGAERVLIFPADEPEFCLSMLEKGVKLDLVAEDDEMAVLEERCQAFPAASYGFAETKGKVLTSETVYPVVISSAALFGRPLGIPQNQEALQSIWKHLAPGGRWVVILNTPEAKKYGRKPSDFSREDILDFARSRFKYSETDTSSLKAQHVILFIK